MSIEYAPRGFIGMLTPQANTTVEAECGILFPAGVGLLAGRLVSGRPSMNERLVDYFDTLEHAARQFGDAPLRALGFACTGASYLAGRAREDEVFGGLTERCGHLVTSSALSVVDALHALSAREISLVSPYPESLTQHSIGYWESRGFTVRAVSRATGTLAADAHPVYGLGSDTAMRALDELRGRAGDAVVMLGTGLPTLRAILAMPAVDTAPVLSCTLAVAWRCVRALEGEDATEASLLSWIGGGDWRARFEQRCLPAHGGALAA